MAVTKGTGAPKGASRKTPQVKAKTMGGAVKTNKSYGSGPVSVYTAPKANPKRTQAAIKATNQQAGTRVFKATTNKAKADVVVKRTKGTNSQYGKTSNHAYQGSQTKSGKGKAFIGVQSLGDIPKATQRRVVQHELGHTIGLDHPGGKKNPYKSTSLGTTKRASRNSGIMGSGRRLSESEVNKIKSIKRKVAKLQRQAGGKK